MTTSNASSRAPLYDLFKLIVAIVLLLIFLCLLIWMKPTGSTPPDEVITATSTVLSATETLPATETVVPASSTSAPLTATPVFTATVLPTDTPLPTITPTPPPSLTETPAPVPETLPTPIVEIPAEPAACEAIARSQLQVGMQAIIERRLNFRSSPGIRNNWLRTNIPGTQVEIVGGPECTRYEKGGAYLWWQIKLPDGRIGWSAEASAFGTFYFMEPVR